MSNLNPKRHKDCWKPGEHGGYREFLAKLSPEERDEHLKARASRKAMRQAMKQVTEEYQAIWTAELHNAAYKLLQKAQDKGDPIAFAAVWDRIIGKPRVDHTELIDQDRPLPFKDEDLS